MEFLIAVVVAALVMGLIVVPLLWHANRKITSSAIPEESPRPARLRQEPEPRTGRTPAPEAETIDVSRIEGKISKSASRKVGGFVEQDPDHAASVIKKWMNSDD
jgi:flagellar biosynthesis/type III secretory pathway M-ring protein FliF/YscJ